MIDQRHSIPLATATSSVPGRRALVDALYVEVEAVFFDRANKGGNLLRTRHVTAKSGKIEWIVAEVVDLESGLFVRLTGGLDKAKPGPTTIANGPFLTFGKQFVSEMQNPQLQNTATKIWR